MLLRRLLIAVGALLLSGILAIPSQSNAQQFAHGQAWFGDATGEYADVTMWPPTVAAASWAAAPNGLADGPGTSAPRHIESGPAMSCMDENGLAHACMFVVYASFRLCTGCTVVRFDWSKPLAGGYTYTYSTIQGWANGWQPTVWYNGVNYNLAALFWNYQFIDMGSQTLPVVSSGSEAKCAYCPLGTAYQSNHQFRRGYNPGWPYYTWTGWCHNYDNIDPPGGAIIVPGQPGCYGGNGWYSYN
jgi:hypothetical protein